ncbi:MAG: hypothetical protein Q7T26_09900 [Dehalococcoidia bacterium]|nr:hypothetical protein [Dehalococcoidia bacterium]
MRWMFVALVLVAAVGASGIAFFAAQTQMLADRVAVLEHSATASPYARGDAYPGVQGLTPQEVRDLREGNGMGLARAAELNGYPGPKHLLDMQTQISLTPEQRDTVSRLYARMKERTTALGKRVLVEEARLEEMFRTRTATPEALAAQVRVVESLRGELRLAHLATHLETLPLLTQAQVVRYNAMRGYGAAPAADDRMHMH